MAPHLALSSPCSYLAPHWATFGSALTLRSWQPAAAPPSSEAQQARMASHGQPGTPAGAG
eukprot:scaffold460549_cov23-Prasinocladus_malaysianus.AAC.1